MDATRNPNAIDCNGYHYTDPIAGGSEFTIKFGPEVEVGPLKAGFSFYKNLSTGESGGKGELNLAVFSFEADRKTPEGGSLNGNQPNEYSGSLLGFYKNFTTGEKGFRPSKAWKLGLQGLMGFEWDWSLKRSEEIVDHNWRCGVDN